MVLATHQPGTLEAREEFFKLLRDSGVTGAKLDFFDHEAKEIVDLYEALLRKAAGAPDPAGVSRVEQAHRSRAHLAARARARKRARHGVERDAGARTPPDHSAVHTYLAGPTDYTTMLFTERRRDSSVAHQIASLAVFASPLLTIAANPESILASPAVDVIKSIPSTWTRRAC